MTINSIFAFSGIMPINKSNPSIVQLDAEEELNRIKKPDIVRGTLVKTGPTILQNKM